MSSRNVDDGAGHCTASTPGAKHRADPYPPPQPSDATELVSLPIPLSRLIEDLQYLDTGAPPLIDGWGRNRCKWAAEALAQAQARATAAEGERAIADAACSDLDVELRAAQQTITQLTRELETARKVLSHPDARMVMLGTREYVGEERYARDYEYCDAQIGPRIARVWRAMAASFLSSLSHQDEQG